MVEYKDITFICVYNNKEILDRYLKASLSQCNKSMNACLIDNTHRSFDSMSAAYNSVLSTIRTKYIIFVHQDITFIPDLLNSITGLLPKLGEFGILGVAGCKEGSDEVFSNIKYGPRLIDAGRHFDKSFIEAQTVDECFFMLNTETILKYPFDEVCCDGWHLYGVDRCLELNRHGYRNYILNIELQHHSKAISMNTAYFTCLKKLMKKYQGKVDWISTTCGNWNMNSFFKIDYLFLKEKIKDIIRYRR